jgi:hypothetical protein
MKEKRLIHCKPGFEQRTFTTCDWIDDKGEHVLHERDYNWTFPKNKGRRLTPAQLAHLVFTETSERFWVTQQLYTDFALASREAKEFDFDAQKSFYCDDANPTWFPIFKDFDKALAFINLKSQDYIYEPLASE